MRLGAALLLAACAADYVSDISELRSRLEQLSSGDSANLSLPAGAHLHLGGEPLVVSAGTSVRITAMAGEDNETVDGDARSQLATIDGDERSRCFDVHGQLELVGLHLTAGVAEQGGAVSAYAGSKVLLRGVSITDCTASSDGSGTAAGGAIDATSAELELSSVEISGSISINTGSGDAVGGGVNAKDSTLRLDQTTVRNCSAWAAGNGDANGGGVSMTGGSATISRSVLENCSVKTGTCRDTPGVFSPFAAVGLASDCAYALPITAIYSGGPLGWWSTGGPSGWCSTSVGETSDSVERLGLPPFEPEGFARADLIADLCPASCAAFGLQAGTPYSLQASCMFSSGKGSAKGGALFKRGSADLMFNGTNVTDSSAWSSGLYDGSIFDNPVSAGGGGVAILGGGTTTFLASTINGCSAVSEGSGHTTGGGVYRTGSSSLLIDSSVVRDCFARGSLHVAGGGISSDLFGTFSSVHVKIIDSNITNCSASKLHGPGAADSGAYGGGVNFQGGGHSDMTVERSIISDCWVYASKLNAGSEMQAAGGGLHNKNGKVAVRNSIIVRCLAQIHVHERTLDGGGGARATGGAIYNVGLLTFVLATLVPSSGCNMTLVLTDVSECRAVASGGGRASADGGGLYSYSLGSVVVSLLVESSVSACSAINEGAGPSSSEAEISVSGMGGARGGGLMGVFTDVTFARSKVSNCSAVSKNGKGLGGAMFVFQKDALGSSGDEALGGLLDQTKGDSKLVINASNVTDNKASTESGGVYAQGGTVEIGSLSRVSNNTAPEGKNLISKSAVVYSFYPLPPGHWLPGSKCRVNREPCPSACANDDSECTSSLNDCLEIYDACSLLPDTNSGAPTVQNKTCNEATFFQECNWKNEPGLLGHQVYTTLNKPIDDDLPYACPPGILGSAEVQYQSSALCERKCPAGFYCPTMATVVAISCPVGSYCPEGSPAHHTCPDGTMGIRTGLTSMEECTPCPEGHWCSPWEAYQCELGLYAAGQPQSRRSPSACTPCPDGSYGHVRGLSEASQCAACPDGHWCSNGHRKTCGKGAYTIATANRTSLEACLACPFNTTTLSSGHGSEEACVCQPTFFDDLGRGATEATDPATGARLCVSCPLGFACNSTNSTSRSSHVAYGFWRPSTAALESKRCPYPNTCVGGPSAASFALEEKATCRDGFKGPFCTLCAKRHTYLDTSRQACRECRSALGMIGGGVGGVALAAALVLFAASRSAPEARSISTAAGCLGWHWWSVCDTLNAGKSVLTTHWKRAWGQPAVAGIRRAFSGVAGKVQPLLGFALVVAQFKDVYQIRYPPEYQTLASVVFRPLQFDWLNWLPAIKLSCVGIDTLFEELLFFSLLPLGIILLVLGFVWMRHRTLVPALPLVLRLTFVFYPAVSSKGFQTLARCDCFDLLDSDDDPTVCLLRASYSVPCVGTGHNKHAPPHLLGLGLAAVLLYGLGVPLLYALLLFSCRTAIRDEQEAPLPKALAFLHEGLHSWALYWPLIEALRALILTGALALVEPGTLFQLVCGLLGAFAYTVLQVWCAPYRAPNENFFAMIINAAIVLNFISMIGVRVMASAHANELDMDELYLSVVLYVAFLAVVSTALLPLVNICGRGRSALPEEQRPSSCVAADGYACGSASALSTRLRRLRKLTHRELKRPLVRDWSGRSSGSPTQGAVPPESELSLTPLSSTPSSSSFRGSFDQERTIDGGAERVNRSVLELANAL